MRRTLALTLVLGFSAALGGCATDPPNPAFLLGVDEAKLAVEAMRDEPVALERPLVVFGGIYDPGFHAPTLAREVKKATGDDRVIAVSFFFTGSFESCRERAIRHVEEAWPSDTPGETVEVDVVGISMGGLVARFSALPREDEEGKRLRIRRLFTIGTPHRGARMAGVPTFDRRIKDMRAGSPFLAALDADRERSGSPEIIPYARTDDAIVGLENSAPPGLEPLWVPNRAMSFSHMSSAEDPRIVADILRRLRGEEPFALPADAAPPAAVTARRPAP